MASSWPSWIWISKWKYEQKLCTLCEKSRHLPSSATEQGYHIQIKSTSNLHQQPLLGTLFIKRWMKLLQCSNQQHIQNQVDFRNQTLKLKPKHVHVFTKCTIKACWHSNLPGKQTAPKNELDGLLVCRCQKASVNCTTKCCGSDAADSVSFLTGVTTSWGASWSPFSSVSTSDTSTTSRTKEIRHYSITNQSALVLRFIQIWVKWGTSTW